MRKPISLTQAKLMRTIGGLLAGFCFCIIGCAHSPSDQIIGKWEPDPKVVNSVVPGAGQKGREFAEEMLSIEFGREKKLYSMGGQCGTYEMDGSVVDMHYTRGVHPYRNGTLSPDGNTLTMIWHSGERVKFVRK